MIVELTDEVPVPRFEDNLWGELARIHAEEGVDRDPAVVDSQRRPGRRRILAGVGAIAAAMALVAGILAFGSGDTTDDGDSGLQARIAAATRTAMADSIVHEISDWEMTAAPVDAETWRDHTSRSVRLLDYEDGHPALDMGPAEVPDVEPPSDATFHTRLLRTVDYCGEEYTVENESSAFDRSSDVPVNDVSVVVSIIDDLTRGWMREDGTQFVDGRELIRVVDSDRGPYTSENEATWLVDPETYRPALLIGDLGEGGGGYVTTFEYLPRTPENLTLLQTADPPAGFTRVDELFRSDEPVSCS